ncbi:PREDICTED: uncharacterized protein LOC105459599 [Wasmannia auropunctata]|uniref:uncharacterized protein LOC105459599 n=1 Tax=Wasmannia auropunctata TaxID=64793 RepID=UPI0005EDCE01|nr:PREDICTED: uncharacterized protein LOC105459599 [Wasmannia auropunctata]
MLNSLPKFWELTRSLTHEEEVHLRTKGTYARTSKKIWQSMNPYNMLLKLLKILEWIILSFRVIFAPNCIKLSEKSTFYVDIQDVKNKQPEKETVKIATAQSWKGIA